VLRTLAHSIDELQESIRKRKERPGEPVGYSSGFPTLDRLGGLIPGNFAIVGGRPGIGKSAMGEALVWNVARAGYVRNRENPDSKPHVAVYFSLEQTAQSVLERHAFRLDPTLDSAGYRSGEFSDEQWDALSRTLARLRVAPVLINDSPSTSVRDVMDELKVIQHDYEVRLVVLDFIQRMKEIQMAGEEGRFQKTGDIAENLADIGKELHVPFWALSQLRRPDKGRSDDDRPIMSDLYGSRQLEAAARLIVLLYRDDYYHVSTPGYVPTGDAELIVAKNNNGPTGLFKMKFDAPRTAFYETTRI
jgi:replicative DNA helicase